MHVVAGRHACGGGGDHGGEAHAWWQRRGGMCAVVVARHKRGGSGGAARGGCGGAAHTRWRTVVARHARGGERGGGARVRWRPWWSGTRAVAVTRRHASMVAVRWVLGQEQPFALCHTGPAQTVLVPWTGPKKPGPVPRPNNKPSFDCSVIKLVRHVSGRGITGQAASLVLFTVLIQQSKISYKISIFWLQEKSDQVTWTKHAHEPS